MPKKLQKSCRYCSTQIPYGKKYCYNHYQAELAKFRTQERDYQKQLAEWEEMSEEDREAANRSAESESLVGHAGLAGAIAGGLIWFYAHKNHQIDGLYGIGIVFACVIATITIGPIQRLIGHLTRAAVRAPAYYAVAAGITWLLSHISNLVQTYQVKIYFLAAPACLILSLLIESSGAHHSSARPRKPTPPTP